jgi:hypothetical protein
MNIKTLTLLSAGVLSGFAGSLLMGNDLVKVLQALTDNGPTHYQEPPNYQNSSGYYPYTPPPPQVPAPERNQHAYDVGYRVGQDDFNKDVSKLFDRHQALYTPDTHEAFAQEYSGGYDAARSRKK